MEPPKYQRKWEELGRTHRRLKKFYSEFVQDGEDDFQGPKDFVLNFFRVHYELKESLKKSDGIPEEFRGHCGKVESLINSNEWLALGLDITNKEKHVILRDGRSNKEVGSITSHLNIFDPNGRDRKEMRIQIDGKPIDCLEIAEKIVKEWKTFLTEHNLIK